MGCFWTLSSCVQGGTCGYGNRGQKARSGPGTRTGFEGGQMPLYRRLPKLKGICGGECFLQRCWQQLKGAQMHLPEVVVHTQTLL